MKIIVIETFALQCPLDRPFGWSQGRINQRATTVARITTDAGISGWGEGAGAAVIHDVFAPFLLGANPLNVNLLWQRMYDALYNSNNVGGFGGSAMSAVDIALWDIAGQVAGAPICALLGGPVRSKVACYATGLYYSDGEFPDRLLDEARRYVDAGFIGMKTKVGGLPPAEDVRRVAALRNAIGPEIHLMVDANQALNPMSAIRLGLQLAAFDLLWFEEPVGAKDLDGYLQVKQALPMAIAGGEALRTRFEFKDFIARRAFDIAQPDVVNVGGISELCAVATLANSFGVQLNPHVWGSPIMIAATLQAAATFAPCPPAREPLPYVQEPVMEFDRTPSAIRERLSPTPFEQRDGFLAVPMKPGLGIEIDETMLAELTVKHELSQL